MAAVICACRMLPETEDEIMMMVVVEDVRLNYPERGCLVEPWWWVGKGGGSGWRVGDVWGSDTSPR